MWLVRVCPLFAIACGPVVLTGDDSTTGTSDATASSAGPSTSSDPPMPTSTIGTTSSPDTSASATTGVDPDTGLDSADFLIPPDTIEAIECSTWLEDCPRGEKCMPWANDGGNSWNATRCSPIAESPREVGESCTAEASPVSGIDDCVQHAMCWYVDTATNMGACVGFCTGSRAEPLCPNDATCMLTSSGVLNLCIPTCNPVAPDCLDGEGCYPHPSGDFVCVPDASQPEGWPGAACEYINACQPGLFCADGQLVPGCADTGCCSPFCDLSDDMADATCDAALAGTTCVPWYDDGQAPPGLEAVGVCLQG